MSSDAHMMTCVAAQRVLDRHLFARDDRNQRRNRKSDSLSSTGWTSRKDTLYCQSHSSELSPCQHSKWCKGAQSKRKVDPFCRHKTKHEEKSLPLC